MLEFLVTSKVRRRLLLLLWGERMEGSVSTLGKAGGVSFASAHAELREMQRLQLVRSNRDQTPEVFSANTDHPNAELLTQLVAAEVQHSLPSPTAADEHLKRNLVALGAPLRGVRPLDVKDNEVLDVLVEGVQLARRDAVVARSLTLCFWHQRDSIDGKALEDVRGSAETKHAFAFFLELTGEIGNDRRLVGLAEQLRDQRLTQLRPFFSGTRVGSEREFPLAAKWGFTMNTDREAFRALFQKFETR